MYASSLSRCISISPRKVSAYLHSVDKSPDDHGHRGHKGHPPDELSNPDNLLSSLIYLSPVSYAKLVTNTAKPVTKLASGSFTGKLKLQKEQVHAWAVGDHPFLMEKGQVADRSVGDHPFLVEKGQVVERSVGDHPFLVEKGQVVERAVGDHPLLTSLTISDADESSPDRDPESHHLHPLEIVLK